MKKPLISIFSTPNGKYFYDACLCRMEEVSDKSYECLKDMLHATSYDENLLTEELEEYRNNGYLETRSAVEEVKHPYTEYLDVFLGRKIEKITLQVTQNCNFRCKYCIYDEKSNDLQRPHSTKQMSWETAKKAVDFLWNHSIDSEKVDIGFYGGEPLLEMKLIEQVVSYSKKKFIGKNLTFSITTNGSLLTEDIIRFLSKNDISLTLSIDGPKDINDKNRVFANNMGTYDKVMENVQLIKKIDTDYMKKLMISMVINPENDFDCLNEACFEADIEDFLNINAAMVDKNYGKEDVAYPESYINKTEYYNFLALLANFERYPSEKISKLNTSWIRIFADDVKKANSAGHLHKMDAPGGPCIPGQSRLFINADGNLYPCERVSELSKIMQLGNLDVGIQIGKARNLLNVGAITAEKCKNCWAFRFCTICAQKADDGENRLSVDRKLMECDNVRENTYHKLRGILLFQEIQEYYRENVITKKRHER